MKETVEISDNCGVTFHSKRKLTEQEKAFWVDGFKNGFTTNDIQPGDDVEAITRQLYENIKNTPSTY